MAAVSRLVAVPHVGLRFPAMSVGQGSTITRGFLFADLRGYTEFVEQRGAAAAAELLAGCSRGLARKRSRSARW